MLSPHSCSSPCLPTPKGTWTWEDFAWLAEARWLLGGSVGSFLKRLQSQQFPLPIEGTQRICSENRRRGFQFAVSFLLNASSPDDITNYKWMGAISPFTWTTPWCTSHGDLGVTWNFLRFSVAEPGGQQSQKTVNSDQFRRTNTYADFSHLCILCIYIYVCIYIYTYTRYCIYIHILGTVYLCIDVYLYCVDLPM